MVIGHGGKAIAGDIDRQLRPHHQVQIAHLVFVRVAGQRLCIARRSVVQAGSLQLLSRPEGHAGNGREALRQLRAVLQEPMPDLVRGDLVQSHRPACMQAEVQADLTADRLPPMIPSMPLFIDQDGANMAHICIKDGLLS